VKDGMNDVIEGIFRSGLVEDASGAKYTHDTSAVTFQTGRVLYDAVRTLKPEKTLEIGMAFGVSTLFICQAHQDNGAGHHTAVDPNERDAYHGIGLLNMERASLTGRLRFYEEPSQQVLPQLWLREEQFDFAFIDGGHLFDQAFVDFYYIDKLLKIGGCVAVDDLWMPAVRKVISFALRNLQYELIRPFGKADRTDPTVILGRFGRHPLGRDWRLKLVPENVALLRKLGEHERRWYHYRTF
jgi:predicted O-methyltransferase YrrM